MAYKEKTCPKCGVTHKKRGEFCSRSCGNSRVMSAEHKAKIGKKKSEWLTSGNDVAEVQKHAFVSKRINGEPDPVGIPTRTPLESNQFVSDGDLWTECDLW